MEKLLELGSGAIVEIAVLFLLLSLVYRLLMQKSLLPRREQVLAHQRGVLLRGGEHARMVEPGFCWVRPNSKLVVVDVRPRSLQVEGYDVLTADAAVCRLSVRGEYQIADPEHFLRASGNAGDTMMYDIRRALTTVARSTHSQALQGTTGAESFAESVKSAVAPEAVKIGLALISLDVWEAVMRGHIAMPPPMPFIQGNGTVH